MLSRMSVDPSDNKLVRNERRKLTATFVNGSAIALFAIGSFGQLTDALGGSGVAPVRLAFMVICVAGALSLHLIARNSLQGLEE